MDTELAIVDEAMLLQRTFMDALFRDVSEELQKIATTEGTFATEEDLAKAWYKYLDKGRVEFYSKVAHSAKEVCYSCAALLIACS